jgi:hypothetical protein
MKEDNFKNTVDMILKMQERRQRILDDMQLELVLIRNLQDSLDSEIKKLREVISEKYTHGGVGFDELP